MLADTLYNSDPVVGILKQEKFSKKRFAWVAPWATIMGWENEKYGDQLIHITLRDSAIVVRFSPYCDTAFTYSDLKGKTLDEEYVVAHQDRIAAVYFVASKKGSRKEKHGTYGKFKRYSNVSINYREYIICNPAMIASWEYGTQDLLNEMNAEVKDITDVEDALRAGQLDTFTYVVMMYDDCWDTAELDAESVLYYYEIAFPNDLYFFSVSSLDRIRLTMKAAATAQHQPLQH